MSSEIWETAKYYCPLKGEMLIFDNYEVSSFGNFRNKKKPHIYLSSTLNGYKSCCLYKDKTNKRTVFIHRVVASTFFGVPENISMTVDHINRIKTDNNINNLQWATHSEQSINTNKRINIANLIPIISIDKDGNETKYNSMSNVHELKANEISRAIIMGIRHKGLYWKICPIYIIPNENWKLWNDKTEISDLGRVRRLHQTGVYYEVIPGKMNGYMQIHKSSDRSYALHRVVAHLFQGVDINDTNIIINHLNEDKNDNRNINLQVTTFSENLKYSKLHIYEVINKITGKVTECVGVKEVSELTGMNIKGVSSYVTGKNKEHKNWRVVKKHKQLKQ